MPSISFSDVQYLFTKPAPSRWEGVNSGLYTSTMDERIEKIESGAVGAITFLNTMGHVQNAFAPKVHQDDSGAVDYIIASSTDDITNPTPIMISREVLGYTMGILPSESVPTNAPQGTVLGTKYLKDTIWDGQDNFVLYFLPSAFLWPFGTKPVWGDILDRLVSDKLVRHGNDAGS